MKILLSSIRGFLCGKIAIRLASLVLLVVLLGSLSGCSWGLFPQPEVYLWTEDFQNFSADKYAWDSSSCSTVDEAAEVLRLTEETGWCRARFFLKEMHLMDVFTVEFDFRMGRSSTSGGDGFTFAFVNSYDYGTPGTNHVSNSGKWLDFEGATGYAVEFDTYHNSESDPGPANHLAIIQDSVTNHLSSVGVENIEDGVWHHAKISFNNGYIEVYLDDILLISHTIANYEPFYGYFGFSAATGGAVNYHEIDNIFLVDSFEAVGSEDPCKNVSGYDLVTYEWRYHLQALSLEYDISRYLVCRAEQAGVPRNGAFPYSDFCELVAWSEDDQMLAGLAAAINPPEKEYTYYEKATNTLHFVQALVKYTSDVGDYWQLPAETLNQQKGDCEDGAILYVALLKSMGYPVLFGTYPGHAFAFVKVDESWVKWVESTPNKCLTAGVWTIAEMNGEYFAMAETAIDPSILSLGYWGLGCGSIPSQHVSQLHIFDCDTKADVTSQLNILQTGCGE